MVVVPRTERLSFEPFTLNDGDLLGNLHTNPEVQRFLGGVWSRETVDANLRQQVFDQQDVGFSKWKISLHGGAFIGKAGIQPFPREGSNRGAQNEIGYAFLPGFWGKGFATEAARAIVSWYFQNTDHDALVAFVEPENVLSQNVLRKAGLSFVGVRDIGLSKPHSVFTIERTQLNLNDKT